MTEAIITPDAGAEPIAPETAEVMAPGIVRHQQASGLRRIPSLGQAGVLARTAWQQVPALTICVSSGNLRADNDRGATKGSVLRVCEEDRDCCATCDQAASIMNKVHVLSA